MYYSTTYKSPIGDIMIAADEKDIVGLWIYGQKYFKDTVDGDFIEKDELAPLQEGCKWLDAYFEGKNPSVESLPLAPIGGEFRQIIWQLLIEIPYGEVTTYGKLAEEAAKRMGKKSMSAQAVGGAVGRNPISIIIPCHRVAGTNGSLTGYAGGIDKKIRLLKHEGANMDGLFIPKKGTAL